MNDPCARYAFEGFPLLKFMSKMSESYPSVTEVPVRALLMFHLLISASNDSRRCSARKQTVHEVSISKTVPRTVAPGFD